jgi:polyisoprenoid-binding protein YceI
MKPSVNTTSVIFVAMMCLLTGIARAQSGESAAAAASAARFDSVPGNSDVRVYGTSTLHDWTVTTPSIDGYIEFKFDLPPQATAQQIREAIVADPKAQVDVIIPVKTMKSTKKDKEMDKKMYEALKRDRYPEISYQLASIELEEGTRADQEEFKAQTIGKLTIAGTTRNMHIPMTLNVIDSQHLRISGSLSMNMTDFKVQPPRAMMGMIKSGDRIEVKFSWNVVRRDASEMNGSR